MELHRQQCQHCKSHEMLDILAREPGRPMVVYVRCLECHRLVARYKLSEYYHHGKGIESFLKSQGSVATDSARHVMEEFERVKKESVEGYRAAVKQLKKEHKDLA
jgi:hypothetical protein